MNTNYNAVVDIARENARHLLRMNQVETRRQKLMALDIELSSIDKDIAKVEKQSAIIAYKSSKLDEADPRFGDQTKDLENEKKYNDELFKDLTDARIEVVKNCDNIRAEITAIEAGEKKVDADALDTLTRDILKEITLKTSIKEAETIVA